MLKRIRDSIVAKLRTLDPKFVAGAVTAVGGYIVATVLGIPVETEITTIAGVPITWGVAIAYVSGQAAAYWKANASTLLRDPEVGDEGNPEVPADVDLDADRGDADLEDPPAHHPV